MIYLSAGHNPFGPNPDPGACANGLHEADLTVELRNLVAVQLLALGASFTVDRDTERLAQYVARVHPGSGSVVCEFHFNAGGEKATGVESIIKKGASITERKLAEQVNKIIVNASGLFNRGVKTEDQTPHKRLAILNTGTGISVLPEICFITNKLDLQLYNKAKEVIASNIAVLLVNYDTKYR